MTKRLDIIEENLRRGWHRVDKTLLGTVFVAALLGMLMAHGFAFANLFPNHDGTVLVFDAQWTMYVLGRWAQNFYFPLVRGKIAAPWLIGVFAILYLGLTGYLMAWLLDLRRGAAAILTALLGCCASVVSALATYTYETDVYLLAMLLACAGVLFLEKARPVLGICGAVVCFCLCLALYQAYIQFAIGLFLLLLLRQALGGADWLHWLRHGVWMLVSLLAGGGLYLVTVRVSLALTGYQLADTGNGLAQITRLGPAAILVGIPAAYRNFFAELLGYSGWNDRGMRVATALLLLACLPGLWLRLRGRGRRAVVQAVVAVVLLPLGLDVIYLLTSGNVYILMQHALFLVYALPLFLFTGGTEVPRALWRWGTAVLCGILLLRMTVCANGAYVYTDLVYENTARQMTAVMAQVQQLPDYREGETPVAFVGDFTESAFAYRNDAFRRYAEGDLHQVNSAVTYDGTIKWWFQHIMGSGAKVVADQAQLDAWAGDDRVLAMPVYPEQGCCAIIDGTAVVKIS